MDGRKRSEGGGGKQEHNGNLRGVLGRTSAPWGTADGLRFGGLLGQQQEKLIYARHDKLKMVQRNKLKMVRQNKLINVRHKKLI
jgi:hypothetical protein